MNCPHCGMFIPLGYHVIREESMCNEISRLRKAILRARRKVSVNQWYDAIVELDKALNKGDVDGKRG